MSHMFLMFLFIFVLLNGFVVTGMVKYVVPQNFKLLFSGILIFLSIFQFIYQFFSRSFANNLSYKMNQILSYIVYYYMAFIIYAAGLFIIAAVLSLIFKGKIGVNFYKVAFIFSIIILIAGTYFKHSTIIKEYEIDSGGKIDTPMNIVLISDTHLGFINENASMRKLSRMINALNPDAVLIAGDLIDFHLDPVLEKDMLAELENIKSTYGVFFAVGNHEIYGGKTDILVEKLNSYPNVKAVRDSKVLVDDKIYIAARDNFSRKPIKDILENSEDKPVILMQHTPDTIDEAVENNVFLQVSGHTHKGQLFPGRLFTKRIFKVDYGYEKIDDTNIIVSQGYGTWGPPIRVGSRSEIVLIKIK